MVKSFIILASSALLFLVGSTLSAPPTPNEPENNLNDLTLVLARLNHLEAKVVRLETELEEEKEKNRLQETEISNLKLSSAQHVPKMVKKNKEVGADGRAVLFPRSCREVAGNGQSIDGIYLVESTATRIGAVFCEFVSGSPPVETQIGLVDIKTSSVHFYVSRTSDYSSVNKVISYEVTHLNLGYAMNVGSGVFTAPKEGVYHFHFSGFGSNWFDVDIRLNGVPIGRCTADDGTGSIQSTLELKKGDTVDLYLANGFLDNQPNEPFTHFTGWLDEEELVLYS